MYIIAENRRARLDYDVKDSIEAGIELRGFEVKSAKAGRMSLAGSYAVIRKNEAWLVNAAIAPYQPGNTPQGYEPTHPRRLLLKKEEIESLSGVAKNKSVSIIPLQAYLKNGIIKMKIAIAKSRKKSDKREILKKKAAPRDMKGDND